LTSNHIEPNASGFIEQGAGHRVYWEEVGDPTGRPALFLHGGPGSGCSPGQRRLIDPEVHRAVLFDQRGSGRSAPLDVERATDLDTNTTPHLISDIEALRELLGIGRWSVVLGLSWGTTLGLAYALAHPDRVGGMVLALVTTTSRDEVDWITEGVGRLFPEEWNRFRSIVPNGLRHLRLVDAYAEMLFDPEMQEVAAREWCRWEDAHVSLAPGHRPSPRYEDPAFRLRFARLVTHYWRNAAFQADTPILERAHDLDGIPGVLIHGRYDVSSPLEVPWRLSKSWKTSRLDVMPDAGHGGDTLLARIDSALAEMAP
jgi:proline iminopeptidase